MSHQSTDSHVAIIGGGIGGLAVGSYLRLNGYRTTVFEKNAVCGGVSVSWKRNGYIFDGATHWIAGSSPACSMHGLLRELIDFSQLDFVDPDEFVVIEHCGETFHVYTDADRLFAEMVRIAPQDRAVSKEFTDAIKRFSSLYLPWDKPPELFTIPDYIRFLAVHHSFAGFYARWRGVSIARYARRFSHTRMREMFSRIFLHHGNFSLFSMIATLGWMHVRSGGYPVGGSAKFAEVMQRKYLDLGGRLAAGCAVTGIRVSRGRAEGVVCEDGTFHGADFIVSAADAYHTMHDLLGGRYCTRQWLKVFTAPVYPALIQVSLGVSRQCAEYPHRIFLPFVTPLRCGSDLLDEMMVRFNSLDPSLAPAGKATIVVQVRVVDYGYWVKMRAEDRARYDEEKQRVAREVIDTLERRFGRICPHIEAVDVATPATYLRYTNIFKGSYQGWAPVPAWVGRTIKKTLPGVKRFYFAGQWVWPAGGLPGVIRIARHTAQILCGKDGKRFTVQC